MNQKRSGKMIPIDSPLQLLLVFVPIAILMEYIFHPQPVYLFLASALAIVPLAGLMGTATEHLSTRLGEGLGGLLNATFGNAAELIIAFLAMRAGLYDLVKASITGSIIGNLLLVFGMSVIAGGIRYPVQRFNRTAASMATTMLVLSSVALVVPAIFREVASGDVVTQERELSLEISIVLIVCYALSLLFSLRTHRHLYAGEGGSGKEEGTVAHWSMKRSVSVLLCATALVAWVSEFLVGATESTARTFGMSQVFVGVILVAVIGNAAEHSTAILMAMKNKMDLAIHIAVGSSIQIALFVAPMLVFLSYFAGPAPMDLQFTRFEVLAVVLASGVMALVSQDGESNWMEGVQLLAVYIILAMAFYFLPA
jgi:Ca2+:H+ antiporter